MIRSYRFILAALFFSLLLLHPPHAAAQDLRITVTVEGKKGKNAKGIIKEIKKGVCDSIIDYLTANMPDIKIPETCNADAEGAYLLVRAEAIFASEPPALNLFLELRNLNNDSIIKQKAHTIATVKDMKEYKDLLYFETTAAMKDLVPKGWKPHIVKEAVLKEKGETPEVQPESKEKIEEVAEEVEGEAIEEEGKKTPPETLKETPPTEETKEIRPPARTGLLLAVSAKDAKVTLDGKNIGTSPLGIIPNIPAGKHQVNVEKSGYNKYSESFTVPAKDGTYRHDIILGSGRATKKNSIAKKWWFWTVLAVIVGGGAAGAAAAVLTQKDETNAVPFPGY